MSYKLSNENKHKIIENIKIESTPDQYYFIMVILSCIIATYGLLSNSTAVIIGAMLIAPLMYPILKSSLSLIINNNSLLKTALFAEIAGIVISIVFSALLTLILPESSIGSELLLRTKPTLIDLLVAFASGLAGTLAICYRPSSAILPGVAIASALMPPLCAVGIGLAKHEFNIAGGALLLFFSNIIAISVAGIIVFRLIGFGQEIFYFGNTGGNNLSKISKYYIYPVVLLIAVSIPLIFFMNKSIQNTRTENTINTTLREGLSIIEPEAILKTINFEDKNKQIVISVSINSIEPLSPEEIKKFENKLEFELSKPVKINAEIIPVYLVNDLETTYKKVDLDKIKLNNQNMEEIKDDFQPIDYMIEKNVQDKLVFLKEAKLKDFSYKYSSASAKYTVYLVISTDKKMEASFINSIKLKLENILSRKVELIVKEVSN